MGHCLAARAGVKKEGQKTDIRTSRGETLEGPCTVWVRNAPHLLMRLNSWSPVGNAGGCASLGVNFERKTRLTYFQFVLLVLYDLSS